MFPGSTKGNIDLKWVKQQQYQRKWHDLMLLAWNASSSIVKQNDCKNKTWLTQTTLPKSFFYVIPLALKNFWKDYFFVQHLFYFKRFSNETIFKFSKNLELKIVKWAKNKMRNLSLWIKCSFSKTKLVFFCPALF